MRDRLKSLQRLRFQISSRVSQRNEPLLISVPLNTTPNFPSLDLGSAEASYDDDTRVQEFLDKVSLLREGIAEMRTLLTDLQAQHNILLTQPSQESVLRENESVLAQFRSKAAWINGSLKSLNRGIESHPTEDAMSASHHGERWTAMSGRIRRTQFDSLSQQFKEVVEEFSAILDDYRSKSRESMQRRLSLIKEDFTAEQVEDVLDNPHTQLVSDEILLEKPLLQQALHDIELRNAELKLLQNTMTELRDIYVVMAALTQEQGVTVNRIERYIDGAGDYIHSGMRQAQVSTLYRRRNRRLCAAICMCSVLVTSVVLLALVILTVIIIDIVLGIAH